MPDNPDRPGQHGPPGWDLDPSEPVITPAAALGYYARMMGEGTDLTLPDLLVATFQAAALRHMAGRIGTDVTGRWPTPIFWPLAQGTAEGRALSIARLPVGAAAAALALELMVAAGVRTVLIVGSAGSIQPGLTPGSLVIPSRAVRSEGTSYHYLPASEEAEPSPVLVDALVSASARRGVETRTGPIWTTDAPYRECAGTVARLRAEGVLAVEMEAAALFAVARHRGVQAALIAAVSDELAEIWNPAFDTLAYRRALLTAADLALDVASDVRPAGTPQAPGQPSSSS